MNKFERSLGAESGNEVPRTARRNKPSRKTLLSLPPHSEAGVPTFDSMTTRATVENSLLAVEAPGNKVIFTMPGAASRGDGASENRLIPWASGLAAEEGKETVGGTFKAFGECLLQGLANTNHIGWLITGVKLVLKTVEWMQVCNGEGGADISVPIPVAPGVDFQVTVHAGRDSELPLTVCFAPSGDSAAGAIRFGPVDIDPAADSWRSEHPRSGHGQRQVPTDPAISEASGRTFSRAEGSCTGAVTRTYTVEGGGHQVLVVSADLSGAMQVKSVHERVAALSRAAEQQLLPKLRDRLQMRDVKFIVAYDPRFNLVVWIRLARPDQNSSEPWLIAVTVNRMTGRIIKVKIRHDHVAGLPDGNPRVTG